MVCCCRPLHDITFDILGGDRYSAWERANRGKPNLVNFGIFIYVDGGLATTLQFSFIADAPLGDNVNAFVVGTLNHGSLIITSHNNFACFDIVMSKSVPLINDYLSIHGYREVTYA